jgi:hypothetical protein
VELKGYPIYIHSHARKVKGLAKPRLAHAQGGDRAQRRSRRANVSIASQPQGNQTMKAVIGLGRHDGTHTRAGDVGSRAGQTVQVFEPKLTACSLRSYACSGCRDTASGKPNESASRPAWRISSGRAMPRW